MDDKKKKYIIPKAEVVDFDDVDIVTTSLVDAEAGWNDGEQETY